MWYWFISPLWTVLSWDFLGFSEFFLFTLFIPLKNCSLFSIFLLCFSKSNHWYICNPGTSSPTSPREALVGSGVFRHPPHGWELQTFPQEEETRSSHVLRTLWVGLFLSYVFFFSFIYWALPFLLGVHCQYFFIVYFHNIYVYLYLSLLISLYACICLYIYIFLLGQFDSRFSIYLW